MVKSKVSTTGASHGGMVSTSAGAYPKSMDSLIDQDGHVSLEVDDYIGYSRDNIEAFLASRPYETHVLFAPDGNLLAIESQWKSGNVTHYPSDDSRAIRAHDVLSNGDGYVSMHFHPVQSVGQGVQIFSPGDISSNNLVLNYGHHGVGMIRTADTFSVRAFDGTYFELRYVGGGSRDRANFSSAYKRQFNKAVKDAWAYQATHGGYDRFVADEASAKSDAWLRKNASKYGFEYNSNWDTEPIT